jgi:hypothetical protein
MWDTLESAIALNCSAAPLESLQNIREEAAIVFSYGPSLRDLLDRHGFVVRTAGEPADIVSAATHCTCASLFPQFVDERIGHVRTMDCKILPRPYCTLLARGLNYRPRLCTDGT